MNILITGGAGFIGSHFVKTVSKLDVDKIVVLDAMTYAADLERLKGFDGTFIKGNIGDYNLVYKILLDYDITHVVHFAAESHVDRSLQDMAPFIETNILGTHVLLNAVDAFWSSQPRVYKERLFIHISTDEVYGPISDTDSPATEESPLNPSNPYAASKAAADQLVLGFINGKGFPALIVRSSNNFGPMQHREKLIPKIIQSLKAGSAIPIYGKGDQRRCWLYVEDYCKVLIRLIELGLCGEIINVKGPSSLSNLTTAKLMKEAYEKQVSKTKTEIIFVEDRKMHDSFYNISDEKLKSIMSTSNFISLESYLDSGKFFMDE